MADTHVHPAIAEYRRTHRPVTNELTYMLHEAEQRENRAAVVKVLTETIPHLYAAEHEDETDVPDEVFALIDRLQRDLITIEFPF